MFMQAQMGDILCSIINKWVYYILKRREQVGSLSVDEFNSTWYNNTLFDSLIRSPNHDEQNI